METTSTAPETLGITRRGPVAWLELQRPERRNAISHQMLDELVAALHELAHDESVRVTVLHGAGAAFSSGFDVERRAAPDGTGPSPANRSYTNTNASARRVDLRHRMEQLLSVWEHPKPVIAAVHGHCLAAGAVLAVFCDMTVVADDAVIGLPALPLGGGYLSPTWVHLVGPKRAKHMSFVAGSTITGKEASDWGWANYSVSPDALMADVARLADAIARTPSDVLMLKKLAINRMVELSGWRSAVLGGAEIDALAHESDGVKQMHAEIGRAGLKDTLQRFRSGTFNV